MPAPTPLLLPLAARFQHSSQQIVTICQDEAVILSLAQNHYYSLDPIGTYLWSFLTVPTSVAELIDRLRARYEIDAETCHHDLSQLLSALLAEGLIVAC